MNITSWNLNGIKAAWSHVIPFNFSNIYADIYCFQETKLQHPSGDYRIPGYWGFFSCDSDKKAYAGTAIYTRILPLRLSYLMSTYAEDFIEIRGPEHAKEGVQISRDNAEAQNKWEGRIITMDFPEFFLVNAYFPNPLRDAKRLGFRKKWDNAFYDYIEKLNSIKQTIVCGDFNLIARKEDSHSQVQSSLQEHVALMSRERTFFFHATDSAFVDAFRFRHPAEKRRGYTWWSNRINYREENKGARLDYFLVPQKLEEDIVECMELFQVYGSDHCPLRLTMDLPVRRYASMHIEGLMKSFEAVERGELYPGLDLSIVWMSVDWDAAKQFVFEKQVEISDYAKKGDIQSAIGFGDMLMDSIYAKLLAVRHVAGSAPGIDHVKWETAEDKIMTVQHLDRKNYKAYPYRAFQMEPHYGKVRTFGAATLYDRAMQTLMAMALDQIEEATGAEYSFAFRKGRCALDAAEYLRYHLQESCIETEPPCAWIVKIDVKQFYESISHTWIKKNIPLDRNLLNEVLEQGFVMGGELFPPKGTGVTAGMQLSPIVGNMVLDGMQKAVYDGLEEAERQRQLEEGIEEDEIEIKPDPDNGRMIRYADDAVFLARTDHDASLILNMVKAFVADRGLMLHRDKTGIFNMKHGITFMHRDYSRLGSTIVIYPAQITIDTFMHNLEETVQDLNITQEELIPILNKKLVAWANYHRLEDCTDSFAHLDVFLKTKLMQRCKFLHPGKSTSWLKHKYFYQDEKERWTYSLPDDRTTKVMYLSDITPAVHCRINADYNPYTFDAESFSEIQRQRSINNVTGRHANIMRRQGWKCIICGQPI